MALLTGIENAQVLIVGASQGIGLEFVHQLLQDAPIAHVYATYRQPASASGLFALRDQHPQRLTCFELDLTDESQIAAQLEQLRSHTDKLHLVINCVGILHEGSMQPEKSLRQLDAAQLMRYFQVNSIGAVLLAKQVLPFFQHGDRSLFATISAKIGSIGDNQLGGWYGYRASKAALNMFMRTAAIEYHRKSPRTIVVTLHPGTTDTRLSRPFQRNVPPEKLFSTHRSVSQLLAVLNNLTETDSGQFFSWDGSRLPW